MLLIFIIIFTTIKIYVTISETSFHDLNINNIEKQKKRLGKRQSYSFAVVGEVANSIDIFDRKILPRINAGKFAFVIFTGNSVMDGAADKYGALFKTMEKLNPPAILTLGDNEISDSGGKRFYRHIGPFYFSFATGNAYFIFLDSTGQTSEEWQKAWLLRQFDEAQGYQYKFVVINRSPVSIQRERKHSLLKKYRMSPDFVHFLQQSFANNKVDAVFSSGRECFKKTIFSGIPYFITGGGGGRFILKKGWYYNFLEVKVSPRQIDCQVVKLDEPEQSTIFHLWKTVWFQIHSWFYVSWITFTLFTSIFSLLFYVFYGIMVARVDYYPQPGTAVKVDNKLKIVMFTNNYLPFVGGVPISIQRLKKGLEAQGHEVYLFAPHYNRKYDNEKNIIRCQPLFQYRQQNFVIPVTNIFSTRIKNEFRRIMPDIVHLHHPYWLGSVGLKLAKKYHVPAVYTYHTRLEQLNQYLPIFRNLAGGRAPHMLIKHFANTCDAVIAPTRTAKLYLRNLGVSKAIAILPTGIDLKGYSKIPAAVPNFSPAKTRKLTLFSVFRLSEEKNPYFLLEGIKIVKEKNLCDFICLIAGDGPEREKMESCIRELDLTECVQLLGNVTSDKIIAYYESADIFVFTSQAETQGLVVLEAMAGGCPVVALSASGIDDMIINGENGYKTEAEVEQWSAQIVKLMQNSSLRHRLAANAYGFARDFSTEMMSGKALNLYYQILASKKPNHN